MKFNLREWLAFGIVAVGGGILILADRAIVKARTLPTITVN
jgi:2-keto-3-deoxy-6-phosphogluconate aldolase